MSRALAQLSNKYLELFETSVSQTLARGMLMFARNSARGMTDDSSNEWKAMAKILFIVEDTQGSRNVARGLCLSGHEVRVCVRGDLALALGRRSDFDVFLLDHGIARANSAALVTALRGEADAAIIVVFPRARSADKAAMLRAGADGCLTSPFAVAEVDACIAAILRRRSNSVSQTALKCACPPSSPTVSLELQVLERRLLVHGIPVRITPTETKLLEVLMAASGKVVTWSDLRQEVWGSLHVSSIDSHISRLRDKLVPEDWRLDTVRGVGLRFLFPAAGRPVTAA